MTGASPEKRLGWLKQTGRKFFSIVYIGGHIFLYLGTHTDRNGSQTIMTLQNIWGLSPLDRSRRAVIGKSVLLPLLLQYPEDTGLASLAAKNYFIAADLSQMPDKKFIPALKSFLAPGNTFRVNQ